MLRYDENSGDLFWRKNMNRSARMGDKISGLSNGYLRVGLNKKRYYAHRIVYKMIHGEEPENIDHINGIRNDNRIENLRSVNRSDNQRNQKIRSDNSTGYVGVSYNKMNKTYCCYIYNNGNEYLGSFKKLTDAVRARKDAEIKYGYHENHGRLAV